jgi:hypothetical protein
MKRFITFTAITAIALTSLTATPAAALGQNEKNVLGILLGLAVIGAVANDMERNRQYNSARPAPTPPARPNPPGHSRWEDRAAPLPASCLRTVRISSRNREVISAGCLEQQGVRTRLPNSCAVEVNTDWGKQKVYTTSCLTDAGYRIARR